MPTEKKSTSIRLTDRGEATLAKLARLLNLPRSGVIEQALSLLERQQEYIPPSTNPRKRGATP